MSQELEIRYLPPSCRDREVAALAEPWIADEGPLDAGLRRGLGGQPLRLRGLAFDPDTTVTWDEDGVQVLRAGAVAEDVLTLRSPVLVRAGFTGPPLLFRIDYLRHGALLGSRFTIMDESHA